MNFQEACQRLGDEIGVKKVENDGSDVFLRKE
jgi:hypothetical protein